MTEQQHLDFDAVQNAITDALALVADFRATLRDDVKHMSSRNRLWMAMDKLEDARDLASAARDRMPKE